MHRQTGIAAALATAIIAIAAEPASADPGPVLPLPAIDVPIDLLPDRSPATGTADAGKGSTKTTEPTNAQPIKTAPTTREHALNTSYGPSRSAARKKTAAASPTPSPTLRLAVPAPPQAAGPSSDQADRYDWFDLAALAIVALTLLAAATTSRRPRVRLPRADDGGFAERFLEARRSRHMSDT